MLWDHSYELGITRIDEQHLQWLLITERLLDALVAGQVKDEIGAIFNELFEYARYHLSYEEELLEANGYPHLEEHKALHASLVEHLTYLHKRMMETGYLESSETITSELVDLVGLCQRWLLEHIELEDKKCASFLCAPLAEVQ